MYVFTPNKIHLVQKGADLFGEVDGFKIRVSMPNQYHKHSVFIDEVRFNLNDHPTLEEVTEKVDQYLEIAKTKILPEVPAWKRSAVAWTNILIYKDQTTREAEVIFAKFKEDRTVPEQEYLGYAALKRAAMVQRRHVYQEFCDAMNSYPKTAKFKWYADEIEAMSEHFLHSLHSLIVEKSGQVQSDMALTYRGLSRFARMALARKILQKYLSQKLLNLERLPIEALRLGDIIEFNGSAVVIERSTGKVRKQVYGRKLDRYNRPEGDAVKIPKDKSSGYKLVNEIMPMTKRFNTLSQYSI